MQTQRTLPLLGLLALAAACADSAPGVLAPEAPSYVAAHEGAGSLVSLDANDLQVRSSGLLVTLRVDWEDDQAWEMVSFSLFRGSTELDVDWTLRPYPGGNVSRQLSHAETLPGAGSYRYCVEVMAKNRSGRGTPTTTHHAGECIDVTVGTGPGSGRIVFGSGRDGNMELYVMRPDGTDQVRLTRNDWYDSDPAWSPDRSRIVFTSWRDGNNEIYVMNADGSGQTRLTSHPGSDDLPAWSPDGGRIAFTSTRDGNYEVYVMNADGTGQTRLTFGPDYDAEPAWSPDGSRIAFTTHHLGGSFEISVMSADGTGRTRLTHHPEPDRFSAWSPDGARIAFHRDGGSTPGIYVMNADGTAQTHLFRLGFHPAWSPDGSRLAFESSRDGNLGSEIYVMNADGTNPVRLTYALSEDEAPSWR